MKKIYFFLLMFLFSLPLYSMDKIKEVGKIDFDKKSNTFLFYFLKENKIQSIIIRPTDKKQLELLKELKDKSVILEGEIRPYVKSNHDNFIYREEVDNTKVRELNTELLKFNPKDIMAKYDQFSHEKNIIKVNTSDSTIGISNKAANSIVFISGAIVGIAAGPIALIPAGVYLINEATKGSK